MRCGSRGGEGNVPGHEGGVEKVNGVDAEAGSLGGLGGADDDEDPAAVGGLATYLR
jgi:hypothetical protein